jgi:hypothetical protein
MIWAQRLILELDSDALFAQLSRAHILPEPAKADNLRLGWSGIGIFSPQEESKLS